MEVAVMKILIADDEYLEHEGLSRMISEMPLQVSEILHAWDGREALKIIESHSPEILITDVRMPVMNGIELLKALNELQRDCELLFISGYEDFHAVREAMILGASNWIVKPVNRDELYDALCRLNVQKLSKEKKRGMDNEVLQLKKKLLSFEQEELIKRYLLCPPSERERDGDAEAAPPGLRINSLQNGQYAVMAADLPSIDDVYPAVSEPPEFPVSAAGPVCMPGGRLAMTLFFPALLNGVNVQSLCETVPEEWRRYLESCCGAPATVGVSMAGSHELLSTFYRQSLAALREQETYGRGKVYFFYEDNPAIHVSAADMNLDDWAALLHRNSFSEIISYVEQAIETAEKSQNLHDSRQFFIKLIHTTAVQAVSFPIWNLLASYTLQNMDDIYNSQTLPVLIDTLNRIFDRWRKTFDSSRVSRNQEIVRDALAIIERDLSEDLYSEAIAGKLYITASHLRRTFKNVMGVTLQDYVLRVRMEKAQEMLRSTRKKVADIAQAVGYNNIPHFTMAFKAYAKITPGSYRSQAGAEERGAK
jgi:two-component system response regulator YesN